MEKDEHELVQQIADIICGPLVYPSGTDLAKARNIATLLATVHSEREKTLREALAILANRVQDLLDCRCGGCEAAAMDAVKEARFAALATPPGA